jgi:hypothetical protein
LRGLSGIEEPRSVISGDSNFPLSLKTKVAKPDIRDLPDTVETQVQRLMEDSRALSDPRLHPSRQLALASLGQ